MLTLKFTVISTDDLQNVSHFDTTETVDSWLRGWRNPATVMHFDEDGTLWRIDSGDHFDVDGRLYWIYRATADSKWEYMYWAGMDGDAD